MQYGNFEVHFPEQDYVNSSKINPLSHLTQLELI